MSSRTTIDPLSITDGKISNQAKINPKKVAPADEASFLITQDDRKYQPKKIHGDGTIDADGRLTISATTSTEEETLPPNSVKVGPANHGDTENRTQNVGEGPDAIPKRDSSGNLKAETADLATNATSASNADKLDNQDSSYYVNTDNATAGTSTTTTGSNGVSWTTQTVPFKEVVATFQYQYNGTGYAGTSFPVVHNLGYIPSVKIYKVSGSDLEEIEMNVVNTTTTTTVSFNYVNFDMKVVLR